MTIRANILRLLSQQTKPWDVVIVGGGATGLGTAVEAASRGLHTLLLERIEFAKGTSRRSTKLVHGGVRYLKQFNIRLVLDALRERGYMLRNAPHLVRDLSFVVPAYDYLSLPYYGMGLSLYERLSGKLSFGPSRLLSRDSTSELLPTIVHSNLKGGILYHDGQFDDSRYAIALLRTLQDLGGTAINYMGVTGLLHKNGKVIGVRAYDHEGGSDLEIPAKIVINATGVNVEEIINLDGQLGEPLLTVSQGTHVVLPKSFLPCTAALMIPKTADGRVLFAIPWHDATIIGTTDEPVTQMSVEPCALNTEKHFLMKHIELYFGARPATDQILSIWSGQRPLLRDGKRASSQLSRDHRIIVAPSGLITATGGKWTTYRRMGQDAIDRASEVVDIAPTTSQTSSLKLHGWQDTPLLGASEWERVYGSDLPLLQALSREDPSLNQLIHPRLPYLLREIVWAARHEMARTIEDILARRTAALLIDARAAIEAAPKVAEVLAKELGRDEAWMQTDLSNFLSVARGYIYEDEA